MTLVLRNFSIVTRYSLKFTLCSLLIVKSLINRCKISSLLVAEVARCKTSLATCSNFAHYSLQKLLVARNHSLVVAEVACCKKSLVTCCGSRVTFCNFIKKRLQHKYFQKIFGHVFCRTSANGCF